MANKSHGHSLIEILVVLAVIVLLSGIIFPIVASSKARSYDASAISNMHQLGIAGALYADESGEWPSLYTLLENRLDPSLAVNPRDSSKRGIDRELAVQLWGERKAMMHLPHRRVSFVSPWTYNMQYRHWQHIHSTSGSGWLIDLTPGVNAGSSFTHWSGPYRRLLFDTSVAARQHRPTETGEGLGEAFISQFADFSDEFLWDYQHRK